MRLLGICTNGFGFFTLHKMRSILSLRAHDLIGLHHLVIGLDPSLYASPLNYDRPISLIGMPFPTEFHNITLAPGL
jgi:hypothetical protein